MSGRTHGGCNVEHELITSKLVATRETAAGEILELAVLLCVKSGDGAGFERNVAQLKSFYSVERCDRPSLCVSGQAS